MRLYVVKISNIHPEKLHYTLRNFDMEYHSPSDPGMYKVYLSVTGKLCSHRGAAYMDSEELAQAFLDYYRPVLDKRRYGPYSIAVESILANKYEQRWFFGTQPKVLALLGRSSC